MKISRSLQCSIVLATMILLGTIFTTPVMADPVVIQLGSLTGTVDPITYTISGNTFTTSSITLSLNQSSQSFFTFDPATNVVTAHTVIDVSFDDGRGSRLTGTVVVDETGMFGTQPILMDIMSGVLSGAGDFNGAVIRGKNPTRIDPEPNPSPTASPIIECTFAVPPGQPPLIVVDLPPGFTNGTGVPLSGGYQATTVPEPTTIVLLISGFAGIGGMVLKRRRHH